MLIDKDRDAVGGEGTDDEWSADRSVVVAEAGVAQRAGKGAENLSTAMGRALSDDKTERAMSDEVSSEQDHIRSQGINVMDDALEEEGFREFIQVDVADLSDAETLEGGGKVRDGESLGNQIDLVPGDLSGIEGKSCRRGS
jgi:hypothetical protein